MTVESRKLHELTPDHANANKGTERGRYALETSLRQYGAGRSILLDKNGRIIAGNKTAEVAADVGMEDVIVVQTDGKQIVAVQRTDLDIDSAEGRGLAYADNRVGELSLEWDAEQVLADLDAGMDLSAFWRQDKLDEMLADLPNLGGMPKLGAQGGDTDDQEGESKYQRIYTRWDVPDALWPSDNDFGIPLLDINMQATAIDQPCATWGAVDRKSTMRGTWMFYTEDYRYEALWVDPSPVVNTQCVNAAEPNFSVYRNMPTSVALWQIYRKRWVSRWWQSMGIRIIVDLNVASNRYELNRLGIPAGWRSFATRGYSDRIDECHAEYEQACSIAGDGVTPLFVVYGGGKSVKEESIRNGWLWFPEAQDKRKNNSIVGG